jgi:hypothetical protein
MVQCSIAGSAWMDCGGEGRPDFTQDPCGCFWIWGSGFWNGWDYSRTNKYSHYLNSGGGLGGDYYWDYDASDHNRNGEAAKPLGGILRNAASWLANKLNPITPVSAAEGNSVPTTGYGQAAPDGRTYDPEDPDYQLFRVRQTICHTSEDGCSVEAARKALLNNAAPGQDEAAYTGKRTLVRDQIVTMGIATGGWVTLPFSCQRFDELRATSRRGLDPSHFPSAILLRAELAMQNVAPKLRCSEGPRNFVSVFSSLPFAFAPPFVV